MSEREIMHRPIPGPEYWDFKCLRCDGLVSDHGTWLQRMIAAFKGAGDE